MTFDYVNYFNLQSQDVLFQTRSIVRGHALLHRSAGHQRCGHRAPRHRHGVPWARTCLMGSTGVTGEITRIVVKAGYITVITGITNSWPWYTQ